MGTPLHAEDATSPLDRRQRTLDLVFGPNADQAHQVFQAAAAHPGGASDNPFLVAVAYAMAHHDAGPGPSSANYTDDPDGDAAYAQDAERFLDAVDATAADFLDIARRVLDAAAHLASPEG